MTLDQAKQQREAAGSIVCQLEEHIAELKRKQRYAADQVAFWDKEVNRLEEEEVRDARFWKSIDEIRAAIARAKTT